MFTRGVTRAMVFFEEVTETTTVPPAVHELKSKEETTAGLLLRNDYTCASETCASWHETDSRDF